MITPLEILRKYWNYPEFRDPQEKIITTILAKKNAIVLLPTGGGKSLCYQIPTLLLNGVCIVISPLIALIQDQIKNLQKKNIKAIALTAQLTQEETIIAFDNLQFGDFKFLYLSPEKLQSPFIQEKIKQLNVSLIAIDEAHCISEWGHDFRPSYLKLKVLNNLQPNATFIALTATATKKVLEDIQDNLELECPVIFKQSFQRSNFVYKVIQTEDIYGNLLQILTNINATIIVYTNSRKQTKETAGFLLKNGFKCSYYHGGLSALEKRDAYDNWMSNETPIMVATNAFGMGIDKSDVRAVIHINTPNSLENYIQEAGRAGRDTLKSYSIILTNKSIILDSVNRFKTNTASTKFVKHVYQNLNQYFAISTGETPADSFDFSLQKFCFTYKLNLLKTYNSIKILERENIVYLDENFRKKSTLKILISSQQIFAYLNDHPSTKELLNLLLRSYGGIFEHYIIINEYLLAKKLKSSKNIVIKQLKDLHINGILDFIYESNTSKLWFLVPREDNFTINRIAKNIEQQNNLKYHKLTTTIAYIQNNTECRNTQLLTYFNELNNLSCGICDVCNSKKTSKNSLKALAQEILLLLNNQNLSSQEICNQLNIPENEILISLKLLLEKNKISITSQNKFKGN